MGKINALTVRVQHTLAAHGVYGQCTIEYADDNTATLTLVTATGTYQVVVGTTGTSLPEMTAIATKSFLTQTGGH